VQTLNSKIHALTHAFLCFETESIPRNNKFVNLKMKSFYWTSVPAAGDAQSGQRLHIGEKSQKGVKIHHCVICGSCLISGPQSIGLLRMELYAEPNNEDKKYDFGPV
jgi:hypothetical protein